MSAASASRPVALAACMLALGLQAGCDDAQDREPLPDWSDGYDTGDSVIAAGGSGPNVVEVDGGVIVFDEDDRFKLDVNPSTTYPIRLREAGTEDAPCALEPGGSKKEIDCQLDMDELDLWVLGLAYDVIVPPGMCDFLWYDNYKYLNFFSGEGPTQVTVTIENGVTTIDPPSVRQVGDDIACEYDYSVDSFGAFGVDEPGPNCCYGRYEVTVNNLDDMTSKTEHKEWGGDIRECYWGGAWLDTQRVIKDGWPLSRYIYLDRNPLYLPLTYEGLSDKYPSNIGLANFYDPADHDGTIPAALDAPLANPHYLFRCLDDAEEVIAEIRLAVREFNEEFEFDVDGDPDTTGIEADFDSPINDITDWRDEAPVPDRYPSYPRPGN